MDAISVFSSNGATEIPHLSVGRKEDWEVNLPSTSDQICSKYTANCIPMYVTIFKEMGFTLPFSPLFVTLLQWMELFPSQLHSHSYPYVKAFDLVCQNLQVSPYKDLFFSIFSVRIETDRKGRRKWVTLCQSRRLFADFEGGFTNFKERFLLVRPRTKVALSNVLKTIERPHARGGVSSTRVPHFNFLWYLDHFDYKPKFYECKYS